MASEVIGAFGAFSWGERKGGDWMTPKEKAFAAEYLIDLSPMHAALRAGYSPGAARDASKWINPSSDKFRPKLKAQIDKLMAERSKRTGVTADRVLVELARVGFADVTAMVDPINGRLKEDLTADDRAAVAAVHVRTGEAGDEYDVRFWDKIKALELIGKHLGMWTDNVRVEAAVPTIVRNADGSVSVTGT